MHVQHGKLQGASIFARISQWHKGNYCLAIKLLRYGYYKCYRSFKVKSLLCHSISIHAQKLKTNELPAK